jgi:hypothetical protein
MTGSGQGGDTDAETPVEARATDDAGAPHAAGGSAQPTPDAAPVSGKVHRYLSWAGNTARALHAVRQANRRGPSPPNAAAKRSNHHRNTHPTPSQQRRRAQHATRRQPTARFTRSSMVPPS